MKLSRKQIDAVAKLYTCGKCEVELVLVWVDKSMWFIHCPECQAEYKIKFSLSLIDIDCKPEEKTDAT